jgi:glucose dehydrogenase
MKKRGELPLEELGKWILLLAGLALVLVALFIYRDKILAAFEWLADFLRFGR